MFQRLFNAADPLFKALASDHQSPSIEPISISPYLAASVLQKAVRRSETALALRAAATLLRSDPAKLWRRLAGITFEDVGLADLDCVALVMAATAGKKQREQFGSEWRIASLVVARMCDAPACRAADDLFIGISHFHELEDLRGDLAGEDLSEHLSRVQGRAALLGASLAALHASGVRWNGQVEGGTSNPKALFAAMRSAGVEPKIMDLAVQGFRRTREALPVLLPLLSLARPSGELPVADDEFPPVVIGRSGIPTYCYDAATRIGGDRGMDVGIAEIDLGRKCPVGVGRIGSPGYGAADALGLDGVLRRG
jgi:hypothetical protein